MVVVGELGPDVGGGGPLLVVLRLARGEGVVAGGSLGGLVAGPAVAAACLANHVELLDLPPAHVGDHQTSAGQQREAKRVAKALRVQLRADEVEVRLAGAEAVVGQAASLAIDPHDLAREGALVVRAQGGRVHSAEVRRVARADPERAVGGRAHGADRVADAVRRDAVERVVGLRARPGGVGPEQHLLLDDLVAAQLDPQELGDHLAVSVAHHRLKLVGVEQVEVAVGGEVGVDGQPEHPAVDGAVHPCAQVEDRGGGPGAGPGHPQPARLLSDEQASVGGPVERDRNVQAGDQSALLEARGVLDRTGLAGERERDDREQDETDVHAVQLQDRRAPSLERSRLNVPPVRPHRQSALASQPQAPDVEHLLRRRWSLSAPRTVGRRIDVPSGTARVVSLRRSGHRRFMSSLSGSVHESMR